MMQVWLSLTRINDKGENCQVIRAGGKNNYITPCLEELLERLRKFTLFFYIFSCAIPRFSNIPLALLSLAGVVSLCFRLPRKRLLSPVAVCLLLFLLSFLLSSIWSSNFQRTLSLSVSMIPGIILFFLVTEFGDKNDYHVIYLSGCAASAWVSVIALNTAISSIELDPSVWIQQTELPYFIVPNDLMLLSLFTPYLFLEGLQHLNRWMRYLAGGLIVLNTSLFVVYRSRGGILLTLIAVFMGLWLTREKIKKNYRYWFVGLLFVIAVDAISGFQLLSKFMAGSESWLTRLAPWSVAWELFTQYPLLGSGPRTFGNFYQDMPWVHNLYIETLTEQGIVGLVTLIGLIASMVGSTTKKLSIESSFTVLFCSVVILIIGGMMEFSFIRHLFVIFFFAITSLVIIFNRYTEEILDMRT